jgi:hypothetical protein
MLALPGALVAAFCAMPQHSLAPWHTAPRAYQGNLQITTCILQITTKYSLSSLSHLSVSFLLLSLSLCLALLFFSFFSLAHLSLYLSLYLSLSLSLSLWL